MESLLRRVVRCVHIYSRCFVVLFEYVCLMVFIINYALNIYLETDTMHAPG